LTVQEFQNQFESITPPDVAWKGDNVGLQIGRPTDTINKVLVALDVTLDVVHEAVRNKINFIVTHHPLLFHPVKNITPDTRAGNLALFIAEKKINLYAAHTNLDSVQWGVNFCLAETLGLKNVKILSPITESLKKIVVFVPKTHIDQVANAMYDAGAGMFTKYDHCSFRGDGIGTFRGMNTAQPFLGTVGILETASEIRLEMLCESWKVKKVLAAMIHAHPYEEVAYDIYPLTNRNTEYGLGAIGELSNALDEKSFLNRVKRTLKVKMLRYTTGKRSIKKVAVCGGSGSEFIIDAIRQNADAMITADVKYHTFQDCEEKILLIDAGHFETEQIVLPALVKEIKRITGTTKVYKTKYLTNQVRYY
jgi:dinuclear metal center YbgI/SA1388 family protein